VTARRPLVDERAIPSQPSRAAPCALPDTPLAALRSGIDACVHCGFCLQSCPTYLTLEDENDSPRGRVLLMRSALEGTLALDDPSLETHIDRCLGCRACETACPSGVPYGHLLEATRATMLQERKLPVAARLILWVFARPTLLRGAMTMSRLLRATHVPALFSRVGGRLGFAMAMLASTGGGGGPRRDSYTARGEGNRGRVALLLGCVMEGLLAETNRATERTLVTNGYSLVSAPGQRCCGALHAHAGELDQARALARANIAAFERSEAEIICSNAAGCGAMMKEYGHLLADDPQWSERAKAISARARDVSELLAAAGPARGGALKCRVTYDAPCHLLHAQRIAEAPLALLRAIPDLELVALEGAEHCCGAAGIYNLVEPDISNAVLDPKLRNIAATRAELVATGNPGCLMQIGAGLRRSSIPARAVHPVDLLDASYAALKRDAGHGTRGADGPRDAGRGTRDA
jgi:glycolate oxidase iron-sulfur subunit